DVKHLVVEHVVENEVWNVRRIEQKADEDGPVGGVVTAQDPARFRPRPGQARLGQSACEIASIEPLEAFLEVLPSTARRRRPRAASALAAGLPGCLLNL